MKWCVLVLAFASVSRGERGLIAYGCPNLNAQEEIDLDKIMGKWYVVEILEHRKPPKLVSNSYVIDSCPIVTLNSLSIEQSSLKLFWTEEAGNLDYDFRIPDISRKKGYWRNIGRQNGTLSERPFQQFVGTVFVMKAVASDMVLTFCAAAPDTQLYSLLLSREHNYLQKSDKRGVHNLLVRRGLKISSIRETCVNGGAGIRRGALDLITWTTLVGILSSSVLFRSRQ